MRGAYDPKPHDNKQTTHGCQPLLKDEIVRPTTASSGFESRWVCFCVSIQGAGVPRAYSGLMPRPPKKDQRSNVTRHGTAASSPLLEVGEPYVLSHDVFRGTFGPPLGVGGMEARTRPQSPMRCPGRCHRLRRPASFCFLRGLEVWIPMASAWRLSGPRQRLPNT